MPTRNKNLQYMVSPEFKDALNSELKRIGWKGSRTDFIHEAVLYLAEKLHMDLPAPKRPSGYQVDALPPGWKSRLYQDRYQLVAEWSEEDQSFIFQHLHLLEELPRGGFSTLRCDTPLAAEVYIYAPESADEAAIKQQAAQDLYEQVDGLLIEES